MDILILSQYYNPEPMPFPHELARTLVCRGHRVRVITGFPNYPRGEVFEGYCQSPIMRETMDGVEVVRLPLYVDHSMSKLRRAAYYLSLMFSATLMGPFVSGRPDVIFVFHPLTMAIPAWVIGLLKRAPYVYNIQDMYPESLAIVGLSPRHPVYRAVGWFARFVYARASAVSVISDGFKRLLVDKGIPAAKVEVIMNWADEETYRPRQRDEALAEASGMAGRFNILFAGNMGPAQDLMSVIRAAGLLEADVPAIQFVFIGSGGELEALVAEADARGLTNVRFLPRRPASEMSAYFALADALLAHLRDEYLFEITIPSKTQSYLAAARPVLMAVKGNAAELVMRAGAGVTARPSDPADIARAARELYEMPEAERAAMAERGYRFFCQNMSLGVCANQYETLFRRLVDKHPDNRIK